jgi:hypothetical protein
MHQQFGAGTAQETVFDRYRRFSYAGRSIPSPAAIVRFQTALAQNDQPLISTEEILPPTAGFYYRKAVGLCGKSGRRAQGGFANGSNRG